MDREIDKQGKVGETGTEKQDKQADAATSDAAKEASRGAAESDAGERASNPDSEAELNRQPQWQPVYRGAQDHTCQGGTTQAFTAGRTSAGAWPRSSRRVR